MKITIALLGALVVASASAGCAPEEKLVCEHEMAVYEGESDKPNYLNTIEDCVEAYAMKKKRNGVNSYRREVECVLASPTQYKIRTCQEQEARRAGK